MKAEIFRGRRVSKPWGYELIWAEAETYVGKLLHIERGESLSLQFHERKDETVHLLSGVLDLEIGDAGEPLTHLRMSPGDSFRIRPRLRHRMTAVETCDVMEASTGEIDDLVRLDDRYGRAGSRRP